MSDWNDPERRYAETKDPDSPKFRHPTPRSTRKNTRRWCRGKEGVEHTVEMRRLWPETWRYCWQYPSFSGRQMCLHEYYCTTCGKRLGLVESRDCPDRREQ